ncbi:MAG: methyl-accepting chemotaxis protein, partial [Ferrovibrio sp.]
QRNAALVEETTAAAQSLNQQAQQLAELVGFFKLGSEARMAQPAPQPAAATRPGAAAPKPAASKPAARAEPARPAATPAPAPAAAARGGDDEEWQEF